MKIRPILITLLAIPMLYAGIASFATAEEKAISVQGSETKPTGLRVDVQTESQSFNVGDPIRFSVKGNKTFFLYIYNVNPESGESVLLLPNEIDKNNKYPANQSVKVPNPQVQFIADNAGGERFMLVASTRYISVDTAKARQAGKMTVVETKSLEKALEDKGIFTAVVNRFRNKPEVFVKEFEINVAGETTPQEPAAGKPVVLLSTSQPKYKVGEKVRIVYGADQAGWLDLYLKDPGGKSQQIASQQISANQLLTLDAEAEDPKGKHGLEVVWRAAEAGDTKSGQDKGLRMLNDPATKINATTNFTIE